MRQYTLAAALSFITALGWFALTPSDAQAHASSSTERVVPRYPSHPYERGIDGYVQRLPELEGRGPDAKLWSARVGAEGGYLGKHGWRGGGNLLLRYWRIGVAAQAHYYTGQNRSETRYLGSAHGTVELVMRPHLTLRAGPGLIGRMDAVVPRGQRPQYRLGPSAMVEADIIPVRPVVGTVRFDVGRLGSRTFASGRASLGVMIRRLEVYLAYEATLLGDQPLRGPQLGLRAWF
jgi:hypothetical protein